MTHEKRAHTLPVTREAYWCALTCRRSPRCDANEVANERPVVAAAVDASCTDCAGGADLLLFSKVLLSEAVSVCE